MNSPHSIQQFIDQLKWLYEPEYGDFKRKVGLYVQRLEETNPELKKGEGEKILDGIRMKVIYDPNGDIETTRKEILVIAQGLLGGGVGGKVH